jgi:cytochrome c553
MSAMRLSVGLAGVGMVLLAACTPQPVERSAGLPGDPARGYRIATGNCAACHGLTGNGSAPGVPKLAGQFPDYLIKQLKAFTAESGEKPSRINPVMAPIAVALSATDKADVASWYAQQYRSKEEPRNPASVAAGKQLFLHGNPAEGLPACASCHRPTGSGIRPDFPNLAAQNPAYVKQQLETWESIRGHPGKLMSIIAPRLAANERGPLADYIASLPPVETPP